MSEKAGNKLLLSKQLNINPDKEIDLEGCRWFAYKKDVTGTFLVCLEDKSTGVVVATPITDPSIRTASHKAWAGARQSRASGTPWEIRFEMGMKGINPDEKLEGTFKGYGHASVGDMARLQAETAYNPIHFCMSMFLEGVINSGQEKSTRYQPKFGSTIIHSIKNYLPVEINSAELMALEKRYQELGNLSLVLFNKHRDLLKEPFSAFYKPDESQKNSFNSRILDCTRNFLLLGQASGMVFETSARDWSRIIGDLKASPMSFYQKMGTQLETLFSPHQDIEKQMEFLAEAPSLIRHTKPSTYTNQNLCNLKPLRDFIAYGSSSADVNDMAVQRSKATININFKGYVDQKVKLMPKIYSEADKMVAQYFLSIWPGLDQGKLLELIHWQEPEYKKRISEIIFNCHDNYRELSYLARVSGTTLTFEASLGELRDLLRHRAWGRFLTLPLVFGTGLDKFTIEQILSSGYGLPLYLTQVPDFKKVRQEFESDLKMYYETLHEFLHDTKIQYGDSINYSFAVNLLPLAHISTLWMHGGPKEAHYMTNQRVKPGGHINYRALAFEANRLVTNSDPYLAALKLEESPNPEDKEQFFNRG